MSSLNSQESSNDICKLTDKQQAEYRNAYQEYIAQMAQIENANMGGEKTAPPHPSQFANSGSAEDKLKDKVSKRGGGSGGGSKGATDATDYNGSDAAPLDPITEEDEKLDPGSSRSLLGRKSSTERNERSGLFQGAADLKLKAGGVGSGGLRYQKLTSDDEESEESDQGPVPKPSAGGRPDGQKAASSTAASGDPKAKDYLSDSMLDKKDSSDSGVRSSESSPNHSLQDEEADLSQLERANLIELDEDGLRKRGSGTAVASGIPSSLSGLQDPAVVRMSICSEDQCSLLASSPEESWPSSRNYNLNRTPSSTTLNNNTNAQQRQAGRAGDNAPTSNNTGGDAIIKPLGTGSGTGTGSTTTGSGSSTTTSTTTGLQNENVRVVHLKRGLNPGDPPEITTVSSDTVTFGEERESIL